MEPIRPLPPGRSLEQVRNHFQVEKVIAARLMASDRDERKLIYAGMYDELFRQVPDHPRLTRRQDDRLTERANAGKYAIVSRFLDASVRFVEFAPGDCRFAFRIAGEVDRVIGVDIADQRDPAATVPGNFELVIYDGYDLGAIAADSIDVVFSDQLLEHLHPEDTGRHFATIRRILRPGGKYVFRTPHPFTGPHDISRYFCDEPEGFHLKEWTHRELARLATETGYSRYVAYFAARGLSQRLPYGLFALGERILGTLPPRRRRAVASYVVPSVCGVAIK